jgi:hypothetical protein
MSHLESPIAPSIGRIVLVRLTGALAAGMGNGATEIPVIVTRVWSNNCINVTTFPDSLPARSISSVGYDQSEDAASCPEGVVWRWMPYQLQTA